MDRKENFKMFDGQKLVTKQTLERKNQFDMKIRKPSEKRKCGNCTSDLICDDCDKLTNLTKIYASNLNELKRQTPDVFGQILPYYSKKRKK